MSSGWGAVAQWRVRQSSGRGSNPTGFAWKFWQFPLPRIACFFRLRDYKPLSILSGVYARGCNRSHTVGKCVTCRGLHILPVQ